jgi:hypothetical protein
MDSSPLPRVLLVFIPLALVTFALATPSANGDPDIFPGARLDAAEGAALATGTRIPRVLRTDQPFDIVLNYYRYKRKQGMQVIEETLAAPFERVASALERGAPAALLSSRFVQQFHRHAFGTTEVDPARAAHAWHEHARRIAGPVQRIGEGERVTIYRPYVSRRTFTVIDETVVVLHSTGGTP